jgi:hypothetical protein
MHRLWIGLPVTLILCLAAPGAATAAEGDPCPASQPRPSISVSDPAGAGSLYATHILRARFGQSGEDSTELRSFTAPGARVFDNREVVSDSPGQLTLTAVFFIQHFGTTFGEQDYSCSMTVSQAVALKAPNRSTVVGRLKRPRLVDRRRNLWYRRVEYSFVVRRASTAADLSPFTVRARAVRRARYPKASAKAFTRVFGQREFDAKEQRYRNGCESGLICQPLAPRGFATGIGVRVNAVSRGLEISVDVPTSYPKGNRVIPTPWGVDVEVFQSGQRIARLRAAGRCVSGGQAARCTFKKVRTKP